MSNTIILFFMVICTNYCIVIDAAKILAFFPIPSISHSKVFRPLTKELVKKGHQVTVITTDPEFPPGDTPSNLLEIDIHDLSYGMWNEKMIPLFHMPMYDLTRNAFQIVTEIFMAQIKSDGVQKLLSDKNVTFDAILIESSVHAEVGLFYIYNIPMIQVSSFGANYDNHNIIGAPDEAIIYHHVFRSKFYNLTFWEKVIEYYHHVTMMKNLANCELVINEMLKYVFDSGVPSLTELRNNVEMLFLNVNPLWDIRPVPSGVVFMGGLHLTKPNELPKDFKEYMDSSSNGVIYVSFGTNIQLSALPPEKIRILLKIFSELPYDVLLKSDMEELEGRSKNVKLSKWFPQADLLMHPKVKLFVTQGGLQSIDETIRAAVPIIGLPIIGEQHLNVEHCVHYGAGIQLDIKIITEESFRSAIVAVISNNSYHHNIVKLRSWMYDQRQTSMERAMWWTEYVLRHNGARHLRSPGANMHWTEKLEINLLILVFVISLFLILISLVAIYCLFKTSFVIIKTHFVGIVQ